MRIIGIIPARYASTRFPGKPLADILGKSMIQRVYEQALSCSSINEVWVATDDERIAVHVNEFGGKSIMTLPSHDSGTERCHEAFEKIDASAEAVINIQGDEPFVSPDQLDQLAQLIAKEEVEIATLVKRIEDPEVLLDPNKVKVGMGSQMQALYFSRSPIPYMRESKIQDWVNSHDYYKHLGLYAYRTEVLREIVHLEEGVLEQSEKLEQLRWLERGKSIYCGITKYESPAVDTPDDLAKIIASGVYS